MPLHHRTIGSSRARIIVVPCVLTPQLPPWAIAHLTPYPLSSSLHSLVILSPLACHHSPSALSIPLSSLHGISPILTTFLSMACVLKRFPLTSPRKLALTCVKWGFLRTAVLHGAPQLSPCAPQVSQCMSMRCLAVMCHAPAPPHHRLLPRANSCLALFPTPQLPLCAIPHLTPDTLSILSLLAFHHSPAALSIHLSFPNRPYPILATFLSMACVLKRFPHTSPRKLTSAVREKGLFTHGRASLNFTIIPMCTPDVAMPCPCGAWQ